MITDHLREIGKNIDLLSTKYNIILIGDLHPEPVEIAVFDFCEIYNLTNLSKYKTHFKCPKKPIYIDLTVTNRPDGFQNTMVMKIG